jgi:magnesium-transporting ATPase (P-type)
MQNAPISSLRRTEVFTSLETGPDGLSGAEAESRLSLYGPNRIHPPKPVKLDYRRLIGQVIHPMALLLWAAGLISFLGGRPVLGSVIWAVVLVNAFFSYLQEYRAERAISSLEALLPDFTRVVRDGHEVSIPAAEIVPGDVLVLAEGDHIPADARVVEEFGLRVNNANLTGEAMPARKTSDSSLRPGLTEVEQTNLVFAGTSVASGTGRAVVYSTGPMTQFGRIAALTRDVPPRTSHLQKEMRRTTRRLTILALVLGAGVFAWGMWEDRVPALSAFLLGVTVIVAVIPEGLVPTLTLSLGIAVQRLARRGVLVKSLAMMETLGTTSVICTDKSGTLTQNQMTVREVWTGGRRFRTSGSGYDPRGSFSPEDNGRGGGEEDLRFLLMAGSLCNNSRIIPPNPERAQWSYLGDQTEAALRVAARKSGLSEEQVQDEYPRISELPFDAHRKRMSTIHRTGDGETAFTKGAPREVLQLCTHIRINGEDRLLTPELREEILGWNDEYAKNALRVLALAYRILPARTGAGADYSNESVEQELTFLGLAAMMDPPRPEVAEAIRRCRQAGIRLVMITGDYGLTADSLARRVGMLATRNPRILTGAELDQLSDMQLKLLLEREVIFARMAPEHKLRLVAAFQERGDVVAVIGDGVNDAPALRKADIGIAMGVSGTDVAREAADVVLTNDNFGAVANAVEEGRAVFDNLRKFSTYIFASNVPELLPLLFTALLNMPLALTITQILAIDMGTDVLPALALGAEAPEPDAMERPPRRRTQPLLDRGLVLRTLWLGFIECVLCSAAFLFVYYWRDPSGWHNALQSVWLPFAELLKTESGTTYVLATTTYLAGVVSAQMGNAFACRTGREHVRKLGFFSNRLLLLGVLGEAGLILAMVYSPLLSDLFELKALPAWFWPVLALFGPVVYVLEAIRKSLDRRGFFRHDRRTNASGVT